MSDQGPRLDWDDEDVSRITEGERDEEQIEKESSDSETEEGLCKVEDPTCEACQ